jgi:cyclopropane fatty-acyl-phospholipid synthase-like methyltransferase
MDTYGKEYFEKYGKLGYTEEATRTYLMPFANAVHHLASSLGLQKGRILDVGCAKGFLVKMLREMGVESYGVDVSEYAISNAPSNIKPYLYRVDVERERIPFHDEFFDFVISVSTFEHLHARRLPFALG